MIPKLKISLLINNLEDAQKAIAYQKEIIPAVSAALIQQDEPKYQSIIKILTTNFPLVSIALGDGGNEENWKLVLDYAKKYQLKHVNMPLDKYHLAKQFLGKNFLINGLLKMSDQKNIVILANQKITLSDLSKYVNFKAFSSLKCLNFKNEIALETFVEIVKLSKQYQLILEPAQGINEDIFKKMLVIFAKYQGYQLIPHIFSPFFKNDKTIDWTLVEKYLAHGKKLLNE